MDIRIPKGTKDILPKDAYKWHYLENTISALCADFGCREIRTPVFEHTELFNRGVGDTTDVVQKEMYTFEDKGGRSITLRPEGTAGVVRSFIENGMTSEPMPVKMYYLITSYRYENVQKGRYREFNQFGTEAFGSEKPEMDVELISLAAILFKKLDLKNIKLNINSIGCPECRSKYNKALGEFLQSRLDGLCTLCKSRFERNPLRIIDCKEESCKRLTADAPVMLDYLCKDCSDHFESVRAGLDNLEIAYNIDPKIVRGLDYYTRTVFEFIADDIGAQATVCGGGRYDKLVETVGGPSTPGIGFGIGLERLLLKMEADGIEIPAPEGPLLYLTSIGAEASKLCAKIAFALRQKGEWAEHDLMGRSVKAQMKYADKIGAKYAAVFGEDEVRTGKVKLKRMSDGTEFEISADELVSGGIKQLAGGND